MRDTDYATEIATASVAGEGEPNSELRVERLFIKKHLREEIRWSWWVEGRMTPRPPDLTEAKLLELMKLGMSKEVFSTDFLVGLRNRIDAHLDAK